MPQTVPTTARARRLLWSGAALAGLLATAVATPSAATASVTAGPGVVISEVYGGGGNSGGVFNRDFVELRNTTDTAQDLSGWSVQYASKTGSSWQVTPLGDITLEPGALLLVGEAFGADSSLPEFVADVDGSIAMSGTGGKVALVDAETELSGSTGIAAADSVEDFVGWGGATDAAGSPAPATTNATSVARDADGTDTADNSTDFTAGAPTPAGGGVPDPEEPEEPEEPADPETASIAEIQGTGDVSPLAGRTVVTTGIVTAHYPSGGLDGYVIQTPGTGGDIDTAQHAASDAVFVYSPEGVSEVALGDTVEVTGDVTEFYGLTEITVAPGAARVLPDAAAPVPASVAWPRTDGEREALESMLLAPQGDYTVTNTYSTNQYGEVGLAAGTEPLRQPTDVARPGTAAATAVAEDNAARAVVLDDGASTNFLGDGNGALTPAWLSLDEPVVVGAPVEFAAPFVVDFRNDSWKLNPTTPVIGDGSGDDPVTFGAARTAAPEDVGGAVSVASFNVLNYFTTLGADTAGCVAYTDPHGDGVTVRSGCDLRGAWDAQDLERQQTKIVAAINDLDAGVVGLMEIENSARLGEDPDEAVATLVTALNDAVGSERWDYVRSPENLPDASSQDVITNAIIYRTDAATPIGASAALADQSGADGAFGNAREPIAQTFDPADGGEPFTVAVNHFKSKGSAGPWPGDADTGDGQGASNESRIRQASALRDWIETDPTGTGAQSVLLVGDFNSYGQEDPLQVLYDAGYVDAEAQFGSDESSYSFSGLSGSLDHVLLNEAAAARATGVDIWSINSGESVALEYSRYNYHGTPLYAPDPFRSSDHDPVIVGLEAGQAEYSATSKTRLLPLPLGNILRWLPNLLTATVSVSDHSRAEGVMEFRADDDLIGTAEVRHGLSLLIVPSALGSGRHEVTATFVPEDASVEGSTSSVRHLIIRR